MARKTSHPLRDAVGDARNRPGVYRMLGRHGEIVYVGKSKSLRTRLLSYFRAKRGEKGHRIVNEASGLEWEYQPSEFAALLRELELIKRFRPRLNVQMKRDGRWSFLKLAPGPAPRLHVVHGVGDDAGTYYGPFRGGRRVVDAVRELNDALGLRDCPPAVPIRFADQADLFSFEPTPGCHRMELRLCLGPCAGGCTQAEYRARVDTARAFLNGAADEPLERLEGRMQAAAERMQFELAATLRDRLRRLEALRDEFAELRGALDGLSFLYEVPGEEGDDRVYIVRRGTVRAVVPAPRRKAERRRLDALADEHFGRPEPTSVVTRHQVDEILLISRWFRLNPAQLQHTTRPARVDAVRLSA